MLRTRILDAAFRRLRRAVDAVVVIFGEAPHVPDCGYCQDKGGCSSCNECGLCAECRLYDEHQEHCPLGGGDLRKWQELQRGMGARGRV